MLVLELDFELVVGGLFLFIMIFRDCGGLILSVGICEGGDKLLFLLILSECSGGVCVVLGEFDFR